MKENIIKSSRPTNILFTHSLNEEQLHNLRSAHIQPLVFPLLKTHLFPPKEFIPTIPTTCSYWVFTSKKAVFAASLMKDLDVSEKTAFAVGDSTAHELIGLGFKEVIVGKKDSQSLAHLILEHQCKEVVHFCGEFHRAELEDSLKTHGIVVHKVVCYTTEKVRLPIALDTVSAISFSSPRGVEAFKESNPIIDSDIPFFSLGKTTANSIVEMFPTHPILVSEHTTKSSLTNSIIHHFLN